MQSTSTRTQSLPSNTITAVAAKKETRNSFLLMALLVSISFFVLGLILMLIISLEKLSNTVDKHIEIWRDINKKVVYLSDYKQLSEYHTSSILERAQELVDQEVLLNNEINQLVNHNLWYAQFLLKPQKVIKLNLESTNNQKILNLLNTLQAVPLSMLQTGYSDWDLSLIVSVRSGKNLAPLKMRATTIDLLHGVLVRVSWAVLLSIIIINVCSFLLIWIRTLKPTFLELENSVAREKIQLKKTMMVRQSKIKQEQEMAVLLDNLPGLVASIDHHYKIVTANRLYKEYFGLDPDGKLNNVFLKEMVGDKNWLKIKPKLQKAFQGAKVVFDIEVELPTGSRFLRATYAPGLKKNGKVSYVLALIVDIHERRLLEDSLRESKENIRITLESIGEGVVATNHKGNVISMNPVAEQLTKWNSRSACGQPITKILNFIDKKYRKSGINLVSDLAFLKDSESFTRNTLLIAKDGHEQEIAFNQSPITGRNGETVGSVIVFRDISRESALNEQLLASEKMRSVGLLASGISHDFNNILAGIQGAAEYTLLSSKGRLNSNEYSMIESILTAVQRGADLSVKLVEFANNKKKKEELVDINKVLKQVLDIFSRTSSKDINVKIEEKASVTSIVGDESGLNSIFLNLLLNAIHAMDNRGEIKIEMLNVNFTLEDCNMSGFELSPGQYLRINVIDTGHGMDKNVIQHIFEPFYTTKDIGDGYGLGLYIVYSNVINGSSAKCVPRFM